MQELNGAFYTPTYIVEMANDRMRKLLGRCGFKYQFYDVDVTDSEMTKYAASGADGGKDWAPGSVQGSNIGEFLRKGKQFLRSGVMIASR